jgi:hypothetical protein
MPDFITTSSSVPDAKLTTSVADGDSLRYYPAFDLPGRARLPPVAAAAAAQVLLVQRWTAASPLVTPIAPSPLSSPAWRDAGDRTGRPWNDLLAGYRRGDLRMTLAD